MHKTQDQIIKADPDEEDFEVMATGESQDERWSTSFRRDIRRQQREILNDVHSKKMATYHQHERDLCLTRCV